jgi:hypothetical protein
MRIDSPAGLPDAVRRLRRGLRDVRDRMARYSRSWRDVSFAGMAGGDHAALMMVTHEGVDRPEVEAVLHRRWPDVVVKSLEQEQPAVTMTAEDAADLGRRRRGVEPLRIVVMPSRIGRSSCQRLEPTPVVIGDAARYSGFETDDSAPQLKKGECK